MSAGPVQFQCSFCGNIYPYFNKLTRHITAYHQNSPKFTVECIDRYCRNSYTSVGSFTKHVQRKHKNLLKPAARADDEAETDHLMEVGQPLGNSDDEGDITADEEMDGENILDQKTVTTMVNSFHKQLTEFMVRMREVHVLPATVQKDLVDSVVHLTSSVVTDYRDIVQQQLPVLDGGSLPRTEAWEEVMSAPQVMNNIPNDASSDYALTNYLKRSHMLVEPREYLLDSAGQCRSYHYVPILEVLGKLLSHGDIYRNVADGEPQSTPDTLCKKKRTDMVIICCNLVSTEFWYKIIRMMCT